MKQQIHVFKIRLVQTVFVAFVLVVLQVLLVTMIKRNILIQYVHCTTTLSITIPTTTTTSTIITNSKRYTTAVTRAMICSSNNYYNNNMYCNNNKKSFTALSSFWNSNYNPIQQQQQQQQQLLQRSNDYNKRKPVILTFLHNYNNNRRRHHHQYHQYHQNRCSRSSNNNSKSLQVIAFTHNYYNRFQLLYRSSSCSSSSSSTGSRNFLRIQQQQSKSQLQSKSQSQLQLQLQSKQNHISSSTSTGITDSHHLFLEQHGKQQQQQQQPICPYEECWIQDSFNLQRILVGTTTTTISSFSTSLPVESNNSTYINNTTTDNNQSTIGTSTSRTTITTNTTTIDNNTLVTQIETTLLQGLVSPVPQSLYVLHRAFTKYYYYYISCYNSTNSTTTATSTNINQLQLISNTLDYLIKDEYILIYHTSILKLGRSSITPTTTSTTTNNYNNVDTPIIPGIHWKVITRKQLQEQQQQQQKQKRKSIDKTIQTTITINDCTLDSDNENIELFFEIDNDNSSSISSTCFYFKKYHQHQQKNQQNQQNQQYSSTSVMSINDLSSMYSTNQLSRYLLSIVEEQSQLSSTSTSTSTIPITNHLQEQEQIQLYIDAIKQRLDITVGTDLRGRGAADVAFILSLAGVMDDNNNNNIYKILTKIVKLEIQRIGYRPSQKIIGLLHIVEKLACSGIYNNIDATSTYQLVAKIIIEKMNLTSSTNKYSNKKNSNKNKTVHNISQQLEQQSINSSTRKQPNRTSTSSNSSSLLIPSEVVQQLQQGSTVYHLLQPRPLLWLWRYSSTLDKVPSLLLKSETAAIQVSTTQTKQTNPYTTFTESMMTTSRANQSATTGTCTSSSNGKVPFDWTSIFKDTNKPLVIDIGSGFGVSLLGLASLSSNNQQKLIQEHKSQVITDLWSNIIDKNIDNTNFIGCDLNQLAVRYSNSIAHRWNVSDHLRYLPIPADVLLDNVINYYPGPVVCILVQFPTPYQLQKLQSEVGEVVSIDMKNDDKIVDTSAWNNKELLQRNRIGNTQLPYDSEVGFMISKSIMSKISFLIHQSTVDSSSLIIQSNCEDVAVHLVTVAKECNLVPVVTTSAISDIENSFHPIKTIATNNVDNDIVNNLDDNDDNNLNSEPEKGMQQEQQQQRIPLRTQRWIEMGGKRAIGYEWSLESLLPPLCSTETEAMCTIQKNPIHRCLLRKK